MELFDTHVHFLAQEGAFAMEPVMSRAVQAGVVGLVAVGGSCDLNKTAVEATQRYPGLVSAAIGFDRSQTDELMSMPLIDDAVGRLRRSVDGLRALGTRICAIGEIGLDYHYAEGTSVLQQSLFSDQCSLAASLHLPVVVHCRDAEEDVLRILGAYRQQCRGRELIGVLHCFTGTLGFAERLLELGFMISFSGIVTFRNADALRDVARTIPLDRLLVETDSPFLAPIPHRGKKNEPAFVRDVVNALATLRGIAPDALARQTTANARALFAFN
ncbi:MAG TPA: hypothetical protein DCS43_02325 [Verrucomicrobia bacterium]|nr:hypothetical protein [Verrucomicrobiota bacterium]